MGGVIRKLEETIADFEVRINNGTDDCAEQHRQLIDRLEKKLATLRDLEAKQWDEKLTGKMPPHVFDRLNSRTVAEIEEVQQALYDAKSSVPEPVDIQERIIAFRDALEALQDPDAPPKEVNRLLKACIERIDYHRDCYTNRGGGRQKGAVPTPIQMHFTLRI
jgi:hypothetical protein